MATSRGHQRDPSSAHDKNLICTRCGGPLAHNGAKSGICGTNPECRSYLRKKAAQGTYNDPERRARALAARMDPHRKCKSCGGQITKVNILGICKNTPECRKAYKLEYDRETARLFGPKAAGRTWTPEQRAMRSKLNRSRRKLNGVVTKQKTLIDPDDGIMDEMAITIAVEGRRVVALTRSERLEVVRRMLRNDPMTNSHEIKRHLGCLLEAAHELIYEAGYEMRRDEYSSANKRQIILPRDRKTKVAC